MKHFKGDRGAQKRGRYVEKQRSRKYFVHVKNEVSRSCYIYKKTLVKLSQFPVWGRYGHRHQTALLMAAPVWCRLGATAGRNRAGSLTHTVTYRWQAQARILRIAAQQRPPLRDIRSKKSSAAQLRRRRNGWQ